MASCSKSKFLSLHVNLILPVGLGSSHNPSIYKFTCLYKFTIILTLAISYTHCQGKSMRCTAALAGYSTPGRPALIAHSAQTMSGEILDCRSSLIFSVPSMVFVVNQWWWCLSIGDYKRLLRGREITTTK